MKRRHVSRTPSSLRLAAAAGALCLFTSACAESTAALPTEGDATTISNPQSIEVDPSLKLEIATGEPAQRPIASVLEVPARLEANEAKLARLAAPVTGRIVELDVAVGQVVKKGDVIATIHSADIAAAQSDLLESVTAHRLARNAVDRARQLLDAGVIGEAERQRRDGEEQQAAAHLAAARQRLGVLGMSADAIDDIVRTRVVNSLTQVVASSSGHVLERAVTTGQVVQIAEVLCVIADLSSLWLVADVPEHVVASLHVGEDVDARIPALDNAELEGRLSFVGPIVDPNTRTIRVRMDLPNPVGRYKPAMLATMRLVDTGGPQWTVPASAVVREGNDNGVFVQTAPNRYELRTVELGDESEGQRILLKGINPNETIVVQGAFHLNNQRRRLSAQAE